MAWKPYSGREAGKSCDFRVEYRFLTTEEGGRLTGPPFQGYHSDWLYEVDNPENVIWMIWPEFENIDGSVFLEDKIPVAWEGTARMWIVNNKMKPEHKERIKLGTKGWFVEGSKKVTVAEVIEVHF